jgi:Ni,Fe-hydrogenase III small subunit/formate hydrogenlyase subunit 6/NADH:ubiquinone oxidoreductase subunit I
MAIWTFDGLKFGIKSVKFPKENDFYDGFYSYIKFDADKCLNSIRNDEDTLDKNNVFNANNDKLSKLKCSKCREVCPTSAIDLLCYYKAKDINNKDIDSNKYNNNETNKDNSGNKYNNNKDININKDIDSIKYNNDDDNNIDYINGNDNITVNISNAGINNANINIIDIKKCIYCGLCVSECLNISKAISFGNYIDKDNVGSDIINNLKFNAIIENFNKGKNNIDKENEENKNNKDKKNDSGNNFSNVNKNRGKFNFFKKSLFVKHIDTGSCGACELEIVALNNPYYNMHRLGIFITPSPRFADVILLTGVFTDKMSDIFYNVLDNTPKPRFILLAGACPLSGGIWSEYNLGFLNNKKNSDILKSENIILVPGCPPNPFMILNALLFIKAGVLI